MSLNLLPYGGGSSIKVMGQCKLTLETKHSINYNTFYVVEGNYGSLLGYPLATKLGLDKYGNKLGFFSLVSFGAPILS
jgi:hypothetical protein